LRRALGSLAALLAAGALGAPAAHAAQVVRLSDERAESRWAHPTGASWVHRGPSAASPRVARLHQRTEDGLPEVYLLLRKRTTAAGDSWVQLRVPGRPNGRTGWVPRDALGAINIVDAAIEVDRRTLTLTFSRAGRVQRRFPVGVGKATTPTPAGRFVIRELLRVPAGHPMYGPYALGTSGYSVLSDWPGGGVIGIHGTDEPGLVPGRPSHGCMRLSNADIRWLARHAPIGTPIRIV
jgi:lipoprotein-anchoring transpeptidase ErfK/SrfK